MIILILGLALWCGVHFIPTLAIGFRSQCIAKWGEKKYKIIFALAIVLAVILIVIGWRATDSSLVYMPPSWGGHLNALMVLIAFLLIAAAKSTTNIKRYIRHPQLAGIVFWSSGHLIANGEVRSLILFGTFLLWSILEMILINKRGDWLKPEALPLKAEISVVIKGVIIYLVFLFAHPYLFGVKPW